MEVVLLVVGKTVTDWLARGITQYAERLGHYIPFSIVTVADVRKQKSSEAQKNVEGQSILKCVNSSDMLVLLDERGREMTSVEYSEYLQKRMASGLKRLVFAVGGPYGFSKDVYDRADGMVSLSRMTFAHEMVRLFFVEQTYRALTILRGEPYHHA